MLRSKPDTMRPYDNKNDRVDNEGNDAGRIAYDCDTGNVIVLASSDGTLAKPAPAGGTGGGGTVLAPTGVAAASPFVIRINWDTSVGAAPAGFTAGVLSAVRYLQSRFTDAVTLNINVGYGETNGSSERLAATNVRIELQGAIALSSGNILHA